MNNEVEFVPEKDRVPDSQILSKLPPGMEKNNVYRPGVIARLRFGHFSSLHLMFFAVPIFLTICIICGACLNDSRNDWIFLLIFAGINAYVYYIVLDSILMGMWVDIYPDQLVFYKDVSFLAPRHVYLKVPRFQGMMLYKNS